MSPSHCNISLKRFGLFIPSPKKTLDQQTVLQWIPTAYLCTGGYLGVSQKQMSLVHCLSGHSRCPQLWIGEGPAGGTHSNAKNKWSSGRFETKKPPCSSRKVKYVMLLLSFWMPGVVFLFKGTRVFLNGNFHPVSSTASKVMGIQISVASFLFPKRPRFSATDWHGMTDSLSAKEGDFVILWGSYTQVRPSLHIRWDEKRMW